MVTVVTTATIGYIEEAIYAVRVAAAVSRRFGLEFGDFIIPEEKRSVIQRLISSSFNPNSQSYGDVALEFALEYVLVDMRELSYLDDVIETSGVGPYVHIITLVEPTGAFTLPSRTGHMELFGISKRIDFAGLLTKEIEIKLAVTDPNGVRIKEGFLGQRRTSSVGVLSNLFGEIAGTNEDMEFSIGDNASTTVLKATGQSGGSLPNEIAESVFRAAYQNDTRPFVMPKDTANLVVIGGTGNLTDGTISGGTDITTAVKGFGIKVSHDFEIVRPNRTGTNNYNKSIQPYIMGAYIKARRVEVTLILDPTSDVISHMEDGSLEILSNEIYIKVLKDNDSADWIAFIFKDAGATYNPLSDYQANVGFIENTQFHTLGWAPQNLTIIGTNSNVILRSAT